MIELSKIPGYVQFETNTYCDQKCVFCVHDKIPKRKIKLEIIKRIVDEAIPTAHTCCPFWFQDPFLESRMQQILRYIKEVNRTCKTTLYESSDQNDPRTVFYLAQTLRGMGRLAEAKEKYKQRLVMGGYKQEIVVSMLCIARIPARLGPLRFVGACRLAWRSDLVSDFWNRPDRGC